MSDGTKKAAPKPKSDRAVIAAAPIKRIAAGVAGKDIRISAEAVTEIVARVTEFTENLVGAALTYTEARKRKTLSVDDIAAGAEIV